MVPRMAESNAELVARIARLTTPGHRGNLISFYKHNAELLKKVGSFVSAGEIISIVGNSGEMTSGPHLHFELWYNGNSLNPEEFVTF